MVVSTQVTPRRAVRVSDVQLARTLDVWIGNGQRVCSGRRISRLVHRCGWREVPDRPLEFETFSGWQGSAQHPEAWLRLSGGEVVEVGVQLLPPPDARPHGREDSVVAEQVAEWAIRRWGRPLWREFRDDGSSLLWAHDDGVCVVLEHTSPMVHALVLTERGRLARHPEAPGHDPAPAASAALVRRRRY